MIRRRTAAGAGVALAVAALLGAAIGANQVSRHRHELARTYLAEHDDLASTAAAQTLAPAAAPATRTIRLCPRGAETLAAAVVSRLGLDLFGKDGRLDLAELARVSSLALIAERRGERSAAAPALPQRMGRTRAADGSSWEPVVPPTLPCRGGTAYASVPVDLP